MLIYSMSVSVDGFIADRDGAFGWSVPSDELFRFHLEQVRGLGSCLLGRRLYETMLVWETDPSMRDNEDTDAFADVWSALPKVVFSRTLGQGARLFPETGPDLALDLVESRVDSKGVTIQVFRPAGRPQYATA